MLHKIGNYKSLQAEKPPDFKCKESLNYKREGSSDKRK